MSFDHLGLSPELLRAVAQEGYTEPTPVQTQAIPLVLAGRDLLAGAQTGTGKTAAFVLPMIQRLHASRPATARAPSVRSILDPDPRARAPGRGERPHLRRGQTDPLGRHLRRRRLRPAGPRASCRAEIVVATPGRLLDHVGQRTIDLSRVEILVLDEADRMLDMGFIRDIRKILAILPPSART